MLVLTSLVFPFLVSLLTAVVAAYFTTSLKIREQQNIEKLRLLTEFQKEIGVIREYGISFYQNQLIDPKIREIFDWFKNDAPKCYGLKEFAGLAFDTRQFEGKFNHIVGLTKLYDVQAVIGCKEEFENLYGKIIFECENCERSLMPWPERLITRRKTKR